MSRSRSWLAFGIFAPHRRRQFNSLPTPYRFFTATPANRSAPAEFVGDRCAAPALRWAEVEVLQEKDAQSADPSVQRCSPLFCKRNALVARHIGQPVSEVHERRFFVRLRVTDEVIPLRRKLADLPIFEPAKGM